MLCHGTAASPLLHINAGEYQYYENSGTLCHGQQSTGDFTILKQKDRNESQLTLLDLFQCCGNLIAEYRFT